MQDLQSSQSSIGIIVTSFASQNCMQRTHAANAAYLNHLAFAGMIRKGRSIDVSDIVTCDTSSQLSIQREDIFAHLRRLLLPPLDSRSMTTSPVQSSNSYSLNCFLLHPHFFASSLHIRLIPFLQLQSSTFQPFSTAILTQPRKPRSLNCPPLASPVPRISVPGRGANSSVCRICKCRSSSTACSRIRREVIEASERFGKMAARRGESESVVVSSAGIKLPLSFLAEISLTLTSSLSLSLLVPAPSTATRFRTQHLHPILTAGSRPCSKGELATRCIPSLAACRPRSMRSDRMGMLRIFLVPMVKFGRGRETRVEIIPW